MTEKEKNDYFYVCALIEYIARETKNHRGDIVNQIGEDGIKKLLYDAEVDHCLSFEQVSDEVVDYYKIKQGDFDTISACKYSIPSFLDIGKLYSIMIEDCAKPGDEVSEPTTAGITFETASGTERLPSLEASSIRLFCSLFLLLAVEALPAAEEDESSTDSEEDEPLLKKFSNEKLSSMYL